MNSRLKLLLIVIFLYINIYIYINFFLLREQTNLRRMRITRHRHIALCDLSEVFTTLTLWMHSTYKESIVILFFTKSNRVSLECSSSVWWQQLRNVMAWSWFNASIWIKNICSKWLEHSLWWTYDVCFTKLNKNKKLN